MRLTGEKTRVDGRCDDALVAAGVPATARAGIPFLKLTGLLIKSLAKPFSRQIRNMAGNVSVLRRTCVWIGQTTNYAVARMSHFTAEGFNHHKFRFVELKQVSQKSPLRDVLRSRKP